jgi:hypothetical protein
MSLTIPKGITTQPVGSTIIEPWLKVPSNMVPESPVAKLSSGLRVPNVIAVPVLAVTAIGLLGGDQARDSKLKELGLEYDPNTGLTRKIRESSSGKRTVSEAPPFTGGQSVGVQYDVKVVMIFQYKTLYMMGFQPQESSEFTRGNIVSKIGPISSVDYRRDSFGNIYAQINGEDFGTSVATLFNGNIQSVSIVSITRRDGQTDTGGDIPTPTREEASGFAGIDSPLDFNRGTVKRVLPPKLSSAIGWGNTKPIDGRAALGIGSINVGDGFAPNKDPKLKSPTIAPNTPGITPKRPPTTPKKEDDKRSPFVPNPSELGNINTKLFEIGSILGTIQANQGTISNNINDIKNNTSTQNLENAAQTGSCRSLNSPSCTSQLKDAIKNPLEAKLDAAQVARDTNAAAQSAALTGIAVEQQAQKGVLASILSKAGEIFDRVGALWNNSLIDKAMQYITMITVIHNAVMLTRGIGDTLGSALDSGLQALGLQIKDKDGNQQGVTQIIGKSFEDLIKGIIGNANYTALTETWIQANRVYQSGINLLSNVQNILDSTTAIAELTSNRVGTLMNALRNAGMVREDAYGAQSQNVTRFNSFMNKLENLEQGTSNVAAITGNIVSVQQSVNELKTNRQELDNALKNKPVGTGAPENKPESDAKQEKREESVFKINDFSIVRAPEETN